MNQIENMFGEGGRFRRHLSKQKRIEFQDTMDTTKLNKNEQYLASWQPGVSPIQNKLSIRKTNTSDNFQRRSYQNER